MEWISVKDKLPEKDYIQDVICVLRSEDLKYTNVVSLTWRMNKFMFFTGSFVDVNNKVTHWMPLPEAP